MGDSPTIISNPGRPGNAPFTGDAEKGCWSREHSGKTWSAAFCRSELRIGLSPRSLGP